MEDYFYSLKGDRLFERAHGAAFIVFEGPDGSGKTTQAGRFNQHLDKLGRKVYLTAEPTLYGEVGRRLRNILSCKESVDPFELQKLFAEDRKGHVERVIEPALREGKTVICDRYFFSTFAYGPQDELEELIKLNEGFIAPDLTICLNVRPEICLERLRLSRSGIDLFEKKEKIEEVLENYLNLSKRFKEINILDGEGTIHDIKARVINLLESTLK